MSVKHSLLALLEEGPAYGYHLRGTFETRTGGVWPLNIGQVYTTLDRLARDGLVQEEPESDQDGRRMYSITDAGRAEVQNWYDQPITDQELPRDELATKVMLAYAAGDPRVIAVIDNQRLATMARLQVLTKRKRDLVPEPHQPAENYHSNILVLESLIFRAESQLRWLAHCENYIRQFPPPANDSHKPRRGTS